MKSLLKLTERIWSVQNTHTEKAGSFKNTKPETSYFGYTVIEADTPECDFSADLKTSSLMEATWYSICNIIQT